MNPARHRRTSAVLRGSLSETGKYFPLFTPFAPRASCQHSARLAQTPKQLWMAASSYAAVLLLLARAGALHPLGWPICRLPQSLPRVVAGCTSLAAARRSRSLSCGKLDQLTLRPGVASRAPAPRLCAEAPGRPAGGLVPSWRRWLAAVAKAVIRLTFLLAAWPFRRLPLRRARETEEQPGVNPGKQPGVQSEVQPSADCAADATDLPQQRLASEPSTNAASPSGGAAPLGWGDALFDFGNRIGRGDDAATPTVLLDEVRNQARTCTCTCTCTCKCTCTRVRADLPRGRR